MAGITTNDLERVGGKLSELKLLATASAHKGQPAGEKALNLVRLRLGNDTAADLPSAIEDRVNELELLLLPILP